MGKIHNPHDIFTKIMLSDPGAARVFLHRYLPLGLSNKLDFSSLKATDKSFVSDEMKESFADLVFECRLKARTENLLLYISILIEHKSNPDEFVSIQMGNYTMSGYKKQIANKVRPLQPIIPFLYYHGDQKWTPERMVDLFGLYPESIKKYIPDYEFVYQNVTRMSDKDIRSLKNNILIPGLLMQKYYKDIRHLLNIAEEFFEYFSKLESMGNLQTTYYVYLFDLLKDKKEEIMQKFEETIWPTADRTKNYIMQLMDKSIAEGKELTIKNLIQEGFDNAFISRIAEVTPQHVEKIRHELKKS